MNTKIIFFDIDGTILSHRDYKISDSTRASIRQARENGHLTFINTGRTFAELDEEIKDLGFDGFVCGCGTYIDYNSQVLYHTTINRTMRQKLIQDFYELKLNAVLEGTSAIYFDRHLNNETVMFVRNMYKGLNFNVLTWDDPDIIFDKFCIRSESREALNSFCDKYEEIFDIIYRDTNFLEIIPKGHSKATGIKYLLSHLNIPYENAYALGDSANDMEMLRYVKHSIGMGNSDEAIKNVVSYITKDVDEGGVAHALKHFHII